MCVTKHSPHAVFGDYLSNRHIFEPSQIVCWHFNVHFLLSVWPSMWLSAKTLHPALQLLLASVLPTIHKLSTPSVLTLSSVKHVCSDLQNWPQEVGTSKSWTRSGKAILLRSLGNISPLVLSIVIALHDLLMQGRFGILPFQKTDDIRYYMHIFITCYLTCQHSKWGKPQCRWGINKASTILC